MGAKTRKFSQARRVVPVMAIGVLLTALHTQNAAAQGAPWQVSVRDPRLMAQGSLSVVASTRGLVLAGDKFVGASTLIIKAPVDLTLRFAGFGAPSNGAVSPFAMRLKLEVGGAGVFFDGAAANLNGMALPLNTSANPNGIALRLSREIQATTSVPAAQYVNDAVVTVTTM